MVSPCVPVRRHIGLLATDGAPQPVPPEHSGAVSIVFGVTRPRGSASRSSVVSDSSSFTFPLAENGKRAHKIYLENPSLMVHSLCDVFS